MAARSPLVLLLASALSGGLLGGFLVYLWVPAHPAETPASTPTPATKQTRQDDPPYRALDANLFMQTAAEYRACCLQAYTLADQRLRAKLADWKKGTKDAAVVFDLDETVLDNAAFQTRQLREGWVYDPKRWDEYEKTGGPSVGLIPGAKEFILALKDAGVVPVYISNRKDEFRKETKEILDRHEIAVPDDRLLLATDPKSSDKTPRRKAVEAKFDVLLYVGDNLRDFDEGFKYDDKAGIAGRKAAVDANRAKFGTDWIILPNVAYGEWWTKPLGKGLKDLDQLGPNKSK